MLHRFFSYVTTTVISDGKTWRQRYIFYLYFYLYGIADAITILIFLTKKRVKNRNSSLLTLNS